MLRFLHFLMSIDLDDLYGASVHAQGLDAGPEVNIFGGLT